jgi:hypothetical protein
MDIELQMIKYLARDAQGTVGFIDEYCAGDKDLFPEVRSEVGGGCVYWEMYSPSRKL